MSFSVIGIIAVLILVLLGIGVMFRIVKVKSIVLFLIILFLIPIIWNIFMQVIQNVFTSLWQ